MTGQVVNLYIQETDLCSEFLVAATTTKEARRCIELQNFLPNSEMVKIQAGGCLLANWLLITMR